MACTLRSREAYEANLVTASLKSKKTYVVPSYNSCGRCPGANSLLPQLQINENEEEVRIEYEFTLQSPNLGTQVGNESFNTKRLVP